MKRKVFGLWIALALTFSVCGCGGNSLSQTSSLKGSESLETSSETPPKEYIDGREVVAAEEVNAFGKEALRLYGRTFVLGKKLCLENAGTGAEICFFGTTLTAELVSGLVAMSCRVFIDGDKEGSLFLVDGNGTYTFAEGLKEGVHTVRIVKCISSQNGRITVRSFSTDGKFLRPENVRKQRIEFVGDSVTVGAGIYGDSSVGCSVANSDATKGYAYLTAQALDADFSLVATEGICVKAKSALSVNMCEMYGYLSSVTTGTYTFPKEYDVVVVALGTNDAWYMSSAPAYTVDAFAADYEELLTLIRSKNKNAKIVCVYGMMGENANIASGINKAIDSMADDRISYLALPAESKGADGHPSMAGAAEQSRVLTEYLRGADM